MGTYRVRVEVEYRVEIDETNLTVEAPPGLQGDSARAAEGRAMWALFRSDVFARDPDLARDLRDALRTMGVRTVLTHGRGRVSVVPDDDSSSARPADAPPPGGAA